MKFSLSDSGNHNRVRRYTDNSVTIRNDTYTNSIIVTQEAIIHPWPVKDIADINEENLLPALDCKQSIWLLGTGALQHFPSPQIRHFIAQHNIGFEAMTTAAACRTFNLLLAEGRDVAALLIINPTTQE